MSSAAGAPKVCSMRTIKSDVVVGLGENGCDVADGLDKLEPGWKISGKYVSTDPYTWYSAELTPPSGCCPRLRRSTRRACSVRMIVLPV